MSQPTGSKQGCQKCSSVKWHSKTCVLNKGNDFYGQSLILDSERSVSDEGRKCVECGHSGNIIGSLCQAVIDWQGKSESCLCRCTFAPCEAEESNFNPDRLITTPRTLAEVYEKERVGAIVTECCGMAIGPDCRFCPKCLIEPLIKVFATALTTATDEGLDKAIAAFNSEIARQAEQPKTMDSVSGNSRCSSKSRSGRQRLFAGKGSNEQITD